MAARRGVGDEVWRLAVRGDARGLRRAAGLLSDYDRHRATAFALAVEGHDGDALVELQEGWTGDWPLPAAYAADVARIRHLAGDDDGALAALRLALHGAERADPSAHEILRAVARRSPRLRLRAARVALGGGSAAQRVRNAVRVALC